MDVRDLPAETASPLVRRLGAGSATLLVVATMVGTGVYTTTGFLLRDLGSAPLVLAAWLVGGLVAACGAVCYAELSAALPGNGGDYHLLGRIVHPGVGFVAGWISLLVGFAAPIAASALAFGHYLEHVWPDVSPRAAGVVLVVVLTALHARSVSGGVRAQNWLTAPKLLFLVLLAAVGLAAGEPSRVAWTAATAGDGVGGAFAVGMIFVYYAYSGWNGAVYVAGEVVDPGRNLPRALIGGTLLVTILYVAVNAAFLAAAPPEALMGAVDVAAVAAEHVVGRAGAVAVAVCVGLGLVSAVGAMIMAGPRIYAAMGERYGALSLLGRRTSNGTPANAVLMQSTVALAVMLFADIEAIYTYAGLTLSLVSAVTVACVVVLRITEPDLPRPYRATGYPVSPLVFVAVMGWAIWMSVSERPMAAAWSAGTLAVGWLIWWGASRRSA